MVLRSPFCYQFECGSGCDRSSCCLFLIAIFRRSANCSFEYQENLMAICGAVGSPLAPAHWLPQSMTHREGWMCVFSLSYSKAPLLIFCIFSALYPIRKSIGLLSNFYFLFLIAALLCILFHSLFREFLLLLF